MSVLILRATASADIWCAMSSVPEVSASEVAADPDLLRLEALMEAGDASEAFFYARRLVAQGEAWAEEWVEKAKRAFEA